MLDELKEDNLLKLILIVRFASALPDVGHPIFENAESSIKSTYRGIMIDLRTE
jgi:hypothetical protein